jgi:hypothetical protein
MSLFRWVLILPIAVALLVAIRPQADAQTGGTRMARFEGQVTIAKSDSNADVAIDLLRWSTDEERQALITALEELAAPPAAQPPAANGGGRGGRGGRGGGGGGGGGRGRGGGDTQAAAPGGIPEVLRNAETVGYVWTAESAGYAIRYAWQIPQPDGGERIILALGDRFATRNPTLWKSAPPEDPPYSLIELRMDAQGRGEGRNVLPVAVAYAFGLDGYEAAPPLLEGLTRVN